MRSGVLMRCTAQRELPASLDEVWALLAEPYHLSDWWPGIHAVRPDRRGLAAGARWEVVGPPMPTLFRRAHAVGKLVVGEVQPAESLRFALLADRLTVEVHLSALSGDRTLATVSVEGPWRPEVLGRPRRLPAVALSRLDALCQTAASLR